MSKEISNTRDNSTLMLNYLLVYTEIKGQELKKDSNFLHYKLIFGKIEL